MKTNVRCCKAHTGLCTNAKCHHFNPHDRKVEWRNTGETCGAWSKCTYLNPVLENVKVRCF